MRIFLDANILFSAALPKSKMAQLLQIIGRHGTCLTNPYAIEEARRNLAIKFPEALKRFASLVAACEGVTALAVEIPVEIGTKDFPILAGAIAAQATHLLTGDETDFGQFFGRTIGGVKIVSPRLLAEEMVRQGILAKD